VKGSVANFDTPERFRAYKGVSFFQARCTDPNFKKTKPLNLLHEFRACVNKKGRNPQQPVRSTR